MKTGTKSILFGVHQFILHPMFVLMAWLLLYKRFPKFYELVGIFIHDLGLWGQPNIDGEEGEQHPSIIYNWCIKKDSKFWKDVGNLVIGHSRFHAHKNNLEITKLYYADKLSMALYPTSLYLALGTLSGEIKEYMSLVDKGKYDKSDVANDNKLIWFLSTQAKLTDLGLGDKPTNFGM